MGGGGEFSIRNVVDALVVWMGDRDDGHDVEGVFVARRDECREVWCRRGKEIRAVGEVLPPFGRHGRREADDGVALPDIVSGLWMKW